MGITVFTTGPACHKCNLTKGRFQKAGIEFTEVTIDDDPDAFEAFRARGMLIAPVVVTDDDEWSDFRIDKIRDLIDRHCAAA